MLKVFMILTRNELRGQLRSKAGLFWSFVFPILLLTVMLLAFGRSNSLGSVKLAFDGNVSGTLAHACGPTIDKAFASGDPVQASRVAPEANGDDVVRVTWPSQRGEPVRITYDFNGPTAAKAASRIIEIALVRCIAESAGTPAGNVVRFENDARAKPPIDYGKFFATGILVMAFMSIGVISTATTIAALRERNTFKMYVCFPVSRLVFLASLIASRILLMLASAATLLLVATYGYKLHLPIWTGQAARAIPVILLGAAMLLSFGTLLASRARSLSEVELWCNVTYYPLLFFSDLTIPLSAAPDWLRAALRLLPTNQFVVALRGIFIDNASYAQMAWPLAAMLGWTLIFLTTATLAFRWYYD
ncbi:ABC-2 type transport system permease protein [Trinickia symbiotica]|uniref:ABC transporter permease n=1 Tax=Trinickia symbiotica TaxID=863227 RepID=A0A2N7X9Y2_9BURK|nr:ABC transporter permease [Trinickia symbiotica]PMS38417.1 ABC transporter permease [Trinickia symbiotica]PPK46426.1 ABC-2 type transport system permease protein [Trinickia symbiotica]